MGICGSKRKDDLALKPKQWPNSPGRRHTGDSFKFGTDLYINLKNGSIEQVYTIGHVLGVGAFGDVKLATHKQNGTKRALKTLAKKKIINEEKQHMFAEVNILRKLDHPNIMKLYELYEDQKNFYLITECLEGGELVKQIQTEKQFTEKDAADYMRQLLSALQYCHKQKIVHRDLKLENLLLDSKSKSAQIKVIDFGTSRKIIQDKYLTAKLGTPHYTAPEVLKGQYTDKCDVWSCGVIMYTLLCGYFPFNGQDARTTQILIEIGRYTFPEEDWGQISSTAKLLIKKMLTYNPDKRISAEEAYNDEWIQGNASERILEPIVIERLKGYYQTHVVKELIVQYMAMHIMSNEEKGELLKQFQQLDMDGDGLISREDLIKALGDNIVTGQVDQILEQCDTNKQGSISFHNFIVLMSKQEVLLKQAKLEEAFNHFDIDGDGFVKKSNFEDVMGGIIIDEKHWEQILKACDKDQDGMISKVEFIELLQCL